ncbi:DUF4259 domain-containing protein [Streptomyces sp. NPDC001380]|uniref:DUF4259 domain-containing protein n=1 Tax=Streptomyces sp. NPDC001380 TaxID=3364566 RepID=UPI0036A29094
MGTWDTGPFDNDTAADVCDALDRAAPDAREDLLRGALLRAAGTVGCLDADTPQEAVAAAALVAAQCPGGEPAGPGCGLEESLSGLTGLRGLAVRALDRVMTEPSELPELWALSDGAPWQVGVHRIRRTLAHRLPADPSRSHAVPPVLRLEGRP